MNSPECAHMSTARAARQSFIDMLEVRVSDLEALTLQDRLDGGPLCKTLDRCFPSLLRRRLPLYSHFSLTARPMHCEANTPRAELPHATHVTYDVTNTT